MTYTQANTRAVYRKTVEEIAAMLNNVNTPAAIADRQLLANLDRRVTHLALVKHRYQNIRANILYARLSPERPRPHSDLRRTALDLCNGPPQRTAGSTLLCRDR